MKKFIGILLFSVFLVNPFYASADIIGDVQLTETAGNPTGTFYFKSFDTVNSTGIYSVYLDYGAVIGGQAYEAFCVEDAWSLSGSNWYTLLEVNSDLSDNSLDPTKYEKAAYIAETYYLTKKAAAQIAIWELMFDSTADLTSGNFYVSYVSSTILEDANEIVADLASIPANASTNWILAVNPTVKAKEAITVMSSQNYLVRKSVPEPTQMLLFGTALIGLAGVGRKRFLK